LRQLGRPRFLCWGDGFLRGRFVLAPGAGLGELFALGLHCGGGGVLGRDFLAQPGELGVPPLQGPEKLGGGRRRELCPVSEQGILQAGLGELAMASHVCREVQAVDVCAAPRTGRRAVRAPT